MVSMGIAIYGVREGVREGGAKIQQTIHENDTNDKPNKQTMLL